MDTELTHVDGRKGTTLPKSSVKMALGQKLMNDANKIIRNYDVIVLQESKRKSFCCGISSSPSEDNISSTFEMSLLLYVYVQDT